MPGRCFASVTAEFHIKSSDISALGNTDLRIWYRPPTSNAFFGFNVSVSPWETRRDVGGLDSLIQEPALDGMGDELRSFSLWMCSGSTPSHSSFYRYKSKKLQEHGMAMPCGSRSSALRHIYFFHVALFSFFPNRTSFFNSPVSRGQVRPPYGMAKESFGWLQISY